MSKSRENILVILLCIVIGTIVIVLMSNSQIPEHKPVKKCGEIKHVFTALRSAGRKRGSTEQPHIVFEHAPGHNDDIEVSFDVMANMHVGDTVCLDFCHHSGCCYHYWIP
jgi:hypothetical protein